MSSSTILFNQPGTYDLNGLYANFGVYACDCTNGNIILSMQQAFATGLYYQIIRIDNSSNTLTLNAYSGDTLNGSYTTLNIQPYADIWCQTVINNNWIVPIEIYSTH